MYLSVFLSRKSSLRYFFLHILYSLSTTFDLLLSERHPDSMRFFRNLHVDVLVLRRNVTFVRSPSSVSCTNFSGLCGRTSRMQMHTFVIYVSQSLSVLIFLYAFMRHVCSKCVRYYQSVSNIEAQTRILWSVLILN